MVDIQYRDQEFIMVMLEQSWLSSTGCGLHWELESGTGLMLRVS